MKANLDAEYLNNEVMLHQIELLRASCERNSTALSITLARQLGGSARFYGMTYISNLTERLEFAVANKQSGAVDEYLKTLEELIKIPIIAVQLSL
jgi:HPt (histidine-containing phosphotransfer) domain-containing protein